MEKQDQIIIYKAEDGQATLEVNLQDETVWLNQAQMVVLFDKNKKTISELTNVTDYKSAPARGNVSTRLIKIA